MPFQSELDSWKFPAHKDVSPVPTVGTQAPSSSELVLPWADGKPAIVAFLRHCGCPFAEKVIKAMRSLAESHGIAHFTAVTQGDAASTERWLESVGGAGKVDIVNDSGRDLFAQWGLGASSLWHVLSPLSMWSVYKLGSSEGIGVKPTEQGSRWQTAGTFAIDGKGSVTWGGAAQSADDLPDLEAALKTIE